MKSMNFSDKVFAFTRENALFSAPCHLVVAVSGGADSMALLHCLLHWPQDGLHLSVIHVNHGLRGENAQRDETFVQRYCDKHNLPLTVYKEDVSSYARAHKQTLEEAGRVLRYQRFEELRNEIGADWIVTAHTASDQTETMLMHLIRGCGLDALQGIPAKRGSICRPLLSCTKDEVLAFCQEHSIPFMVDETNEDTRFTRNRIRHELMPLLRDINPAVEASLLRFQHHIAEDVTFLDGLTQEVLSNATVGDSVSVTLLLEALQPIRRRAIRALLRRHYLKTIEETHILAIEKLLMSGCGKTLLPDNQVAEVQGGFLTIKKHKQLKNNTKDPLSISLDRFPITFTVYDVQYTISLMEYPDTENVHNLFANLALDYDTIQGDLTVRARQAGDVLRPAGRGISKSIKKLMNEWKIPAESRDSFPLICDSNGVLLVPGYACDQRAVITNDTKRCLTIQTH